jgi:hypothetical protein
MPETGDSGDRGGDGFLSRWSRRKTRSRQGQPPRAEARVDARQGRSLASAPAEDGMPAPAAGPAAGDEPVLTDADMPPLDSLGPDSDYSGFLSPGVSKDLRRQALARLFRSAAFNVTDGLDDYAEDFTSFTPLGDLLTADLRHRLEHQLQRSAERLDDAAPATAAETGEATTDDTEAPEAAVALAANPGDPPADLREPKDDAEPQVRPVHRPAPGGCPDESV